MLGTVATAAANGSFSLPFGLTTAFLSAGVAILLLSAIGLRHPLLVFGALLAWFPFSDLLRKLGQGDPRLILGRDILLVIGSVALAMRMPVWRDVIRVFRGWWWPLILCIGYFVATGAQSIDSWKLPLSGLRLYFGYLPLIAVGWYVSINHERRRRAVFWIGVVLCLGTALGVVHAILGPTFLAPSASLDYFKHLDLQRLTTGQSGPAVFQPSGPFVEPGRFANWAFVTFVVGFALFEQTELGRSRFLVLAVGALGVLAASGRAILLASVVLTLAMVAWHFRGRRGRGLRVAGAVVIVVLPLVSVAYVVAPDVVSSRVRFLSLSLNPLSSTSEISTRPAFYPKITARAVEEGGLFGRGVGEQSLGTQYLSGVKREATFGEGGFATVAVETGFVGLCLWVAWTWMWCRHLRRLSAEAAEADAGSVAVIGYAITVVLFLLFWLGINAIQDFVLNSTVFLGTGIAMGLSRGQHEIVDGDTS